MKKLIKDVETATFGSRRLDARIDSSFSGWFPSYLCRDSTRRSYGEGFVHRLDDNSFLLSKDGRNVLYYTVSLDAAKTLLPEGFEWLCQSDKEKGGFANVAKDFKPGVIILEGGQTRDNSTGTSFQAYASTPELALCSAILKARNQTNVGNS